MSKKGHQRPAGKRSQSSLTRSKWRPRYGNWSSAVRTHRLVCSRRWWLQEREFLAWGLVRREFCPRHDSDAHSLEALRSGAVSPLLPPQYFPILGLDVAEPKWVLQPKTSEENLESTTVGLFQDASRGCNGRSESRACPGLTGTWGHRGARRARSMRDASWKKKMLS